MSLTPEQGTELRAAIDERHRTLMREVREGMTRARNDTMTDLAGPAPDPGDESVATLIADLDYADVSRDVQELRALEDARERMSRGEYGTCDECGNDIDFRRLRANPTALRCTECQTMWEKTHAGPSRPTL